MGGDGNYFTTGDFNGDGIEELIIRNGPNGAVGSFYFNSSDELVFQQNYLEMPGYFRSADINGDEYIDIISWHLEQDIFMIYYGGPGSDYDYDILYQSENITTSYFWSNIGDVNGDGEDEILINNRANEDDLGNNATIYGIPGSDANEEWKIVNCKLKINSVVWDGKDEYRNIVSSGIYLYRLVDDGRVLTSQKMILMK